MICVLKLLNDYEIFLIFFFVLVYIKFIWGNIFWKDIFFVDVKEFWNLFLNEIKFVLFFMIFFMFVWKGVKIMVVNEFLKLSLCVRNMCLNDECVKNLYFFIFFVLED